MSGLEGEFDERDEEIGVLCQLSIQVRCLETGVMPQRPIVTPLDRRDASGTEMLSMAIQGVHQEGQVVAVQGASPCLPVFLFDPFLETGGRLLCELRLGSEGVQMGCQK